jgi:hypothetical protein
MLLAAAATHGQLLKCIGPDGRIEYANQCPSGTREEQTGIRSAPGGPAPSASPQQKSYIEQDAAFKKRRAEQEETRQKDEKRMAEAEQRRQACESAQGYLRSLRAGERITRADPRTGERTYLDDAERAGEIARAQQAVDVNCK